MATDLILKHDNGIDINLGRLHNFVIDGPATLTDLITEIQEYRSTYDELQKEILELFVYVTHHNSDPDEAVQRIKDVAEAISEKIRQNGRQDVLRWLCDEGFELDISF